MKNLILLIVLCSCASTAENGERKPSAFGRTLQAFFAGLGEGIKDQPPIQTPPKPVSCITTGSPGMYTTNCY